MSENKLLQIALDPDGIQLTYVHVPDDIRKNGLMWQHAVLVPHASDYDDEIEALTDAAQALLEDVLEDQATAEVIDPEQPTENEEEDAD